LLRVDEKAFEARKFRGFFRKKYREVLEEKNRLVDNYRHVSGYKEDLTHLREIIDTKKQEAYETLNDILLDEFRDLSIKYEQATWDEKKQTVERRRSGRSHRRISKLLTCFTGDSSSTKS